MFTSNESDHLLRADVTGCNLQIRSVSIGLLSAAINLIMQTRQKEKEL